MASRKLASACLVCEVALQGVLGAVARMTGVGRSRGNPNLCNRCNGHVEEGRIVELAVFFADLTGYTRLTQSLGPQQMHELLDAYLRGATDVIVDHDGYVSQFVGDEVMAFFNAPIKRDDFAQRAVAAGFALQQAVHELGEKLGQPIQATIGIALGYARVGRVGTEAIAHYSAIGDVVNRAARLVSKVEPGGLLVDEDIYTAVAHEYPNAKLETVSLKGFSEPVTVAGFNQTQILAAAEHEPAAPQTVKAATALAALLSAPCAGYVALNSVGLALGFGAVSMGGIAKFFDQTLLRVPLLTLATLGALAILYIVLRPNSVSDMQSALATEPTTFERRRNRTGIILAILALAIVVAELFAHNVMH